MVSNCSISVGTDQEMVNHSSTLEISVDSHLSQRGEVVGRFNYVLLVEARRKDVRLRIVVKILFLAFIRRMDNRVFNLVLDHNQIVDLNF